MRTLRTENISADVDKLAQHAFNRMGLVCLVATTVDEGTLLTTRAEWRDRADAQDDWWFRTQADADSILAEMTELKAMLWSGRRVECGVLLDVQVDRVADVVAECRKWAWRVNLITREEVDAKMAGVKQEVVRWLVRLETTEAMSPLNKEFKRQRLAAKAEGVKFPSLRIWMTNKLEQLVLAPETLARITSSVDATAA